MPLLHEVRMLLKVLVFVVFQHKHSAFAQQVVFKDEVDQLVVVFAVVRRVGKDEVVLHLVLVQKAVYVGTNHKQLLHVEFESGFANELYAAKILVDRHYFGTAS